jgi:anti-anti-sigma factor
LVLDQGGSRARLRVAGEMSAVACARLDEALTWMIELGCHSVTVELASIERLDAAYLGVLRMAQRRLRGDGGQLTVTLARPELARVLALTGIGGGLVAGKACVASSLRNVPLASVRDLGSYHRTDG